ncbi:MAG: rod shape-determining protein MreC [Anaerolineales bacterium]
MVWSAAAPATPDHPRMNFPRTFQTLIIILIVAGLLLLALGGYLAPLGRVALDPLIGIQTWVATRFQAVQDYLNTPPDMARLTQRNLELEAEVANLQAQIIELQQQTADLQVLSALLGFVRAHPEHQYLTAAVIGYDTNPFLRYVIINRGSDDGLRRGMPVVTEQGLAGRIAAVTANAARVQLITDPQSAVNVLIQPSGAEAVMNGSITGEIHLEWIPHDAEVQVGDLVLTSGLGGNYPQNILIGQVSSGRQRPFDLFQSAQLQPVVDFSDLKIVLVIVNFRPIDIAPLIPTPELP